MKILLIDNNTVHRQALSRSLAGHDVEIQLYKPGLDFHCHGKDLVILSGGGGEGQEITDIHEEDQLWYEDEMEFVRSSPKPIVGICMGFEVMAKAHGQAVPSLNKLIYENGTLTATERGWRLFGKHKFKQVEAHHWHVPEAPYGFEVLAQSENGVEIMYNPFRRQLGTQFHPELGGTLALNRLFRALA